VAKIIFLKGLPASGKSTWAESQLGKGNCFIVSKDAIRAALGGYSTKKEKYVVRLRNQLVREGLDLGRTVIIDDTNLNPAHERVLRQIAKEKGVAFEINDSFLSVSPEECIARDLHRGAKAVGAKVIWGMYDKWLCPDPIKKLDKEWKKRRCLILDIDGTLAHNTSGRSFYDLTQVYKDTPDPLLSMIADAVTETETTYCDIVIVSGREDTCREVTEKWLDDNMIPYKALFMRKGGDKRPDEVVKEEIYHNDIEPNWAVLGVFDDRPKVCRMWRKQGLRVAQVGNPDVEF